MVASAEDRNILVEQLVMALVRHHSLEHSVISARRRLAPTVAQVLQPSQMTTDYLHLARPQLSLASVPGQDLRASEPRDP